MYYLRISGAGFTKSAVMFAVKEDIMILIKTSYFSYLKQNIGDLIKYLGALETGKTSVCGGRSC